MKNRWTSFESSSRFRRKNWIFAKVLLLVALAAYGLYLNHLGDLVTIIERTLAIVGMAGTALFYAKWKGAEKEAKREKDDSTE